MNNKSKLFNLFNYFFMVIFLLGAVVQFNDPDPLQWIIIYLMAALASVLFKWFNMHWSFSLVIGIASLIWAGILAPNVIEANAYSEIFNEIEMKNVGIEETREMLGLLIITAWMIVLTIVSFKLSSYHKEETL